jgi:hypothetical protein
VSALFLSYISRPPSARTMAAVSCPSRAPASRASRPSIGSATQRGRRRRTKCSWHAPPPQIQHRILPHALPLIFLEHRGSSALHTALLYCCHCHYLPRADTQPHLTDALHDRLSPHTSRTPATSRCRLHSSQPERWRLQSAP